MIAFSTHAQTPNEDPLAPLEELAGENADTERLRTAPEDSQTKIRILLEPVQSAILSSEMDGKIVRIHKRNGERFAKDDRLVTFDCGSQEVELQRLNARLNSARLIHENALQLQKLNSIGDLDVNLAEAETYIAEAELAAAELNAKRCVINAPFPGRVIELARKQHEWISRSEPLMEIYNDRDYLLKMLVPSEWLSWLKVGHDFKVTIDETGREYVASIHKIGARIDPVSRSVEVRGKITDQDPDFLHSMSGDAYFDVPLP